MQWTCEWGMVCDRGVRRSENQDAALLWTAGTAIDLPDPENNKTLNGGAVMVPGSSTGDSKSKQLFTGLFALVADGMGGGPAGGKASRLIVETALPIVESTSTEDMTKYFSGLVNSCDETIYQDALKNGLIGMGSTCTALVLDENHAHLCHIGDSRCYRINNEASALEQWTDDHNMAAQLVNDGTIEASEAATHPSSRILIQAVGLGKELSPQFGSAEIASAGETFLLCSDGLIRVIEEREILVSIAPYLDLDPESQEFMGGAGEKRPMQVAAEQLLALANRRGAPDNVTIVILNVKPSID